MCVVTLENVAGTLQVIVSVRAQQLLNGASLMVDKQDILDQTPATHTREWGLERHARNVLQPACFKVVRLLT